MSRLFFGGLFSTSHALIRDVTLINFDQFDQTIFSKLCFPVFHQYYLDEAIFEVLTEDLEEKVEPKEMKGRTRKFYTFV